MSLQASDSVAQEEWVQAQARLVRAVAGEIEFGRVERAWRLGCHVALTAVTVAGLIVALVRA